MSIQIANTGLGNSFDTWRLNTNEMATIIGNNVVTVGSAGADRKSFTVGNGHIVGTFTANELRTSTLKGGNTSVDGDIVISSNTTIGGDGLGTSRTLTVHANTTLSGNVIIDTVGQEVFKMGSIDRIRVTGGTTGQFLQLRDRNDNPDFVYLKLRDITDLSTNSAHIILSGANTTFSDNGDSPHLIFSAPNDDSIEIFLAKSAGVGDSDLYVKLVDSDGDSVFAIVDSANTIVAQIDSNGDADFEGRITAAGFTAQATILPSADDQIDLGSSTFEFKDAYIDGVAYVDELSLGTSAGQGVSTSIIPKTHASYNLGSATRFWTDSYFSGIQRSNEGRFVTLGVAKNFTANGETRLSNTTVTELQCNNEVYMWGNLHVWGNSSLSNTTVTRFAANGHATFKTDTVIQGTTSAHRVTTTSLLANDDVVFNGDSVRIAGNTHISDQLLVANNVTLSGNVVLGRPGPSPTTITVNGRLANQHTVGLATFRSEASGGGVGIGGAVTSGYDLTVHGDANIKTNLAVDNNVTIGGDLTLSVDSNFTVPSGAILTADDQRVTNIRVSGNTFLGDATTDNVTINGTVISDILVETGKRHNLGSTTASWHQVYANNVTVGDNVTIGDDLTVGENTILQGNTTLSGYVLRDGFTGEDQYIFNNNGKLWANNTIASNTILTSMLENTAVADLFDGTGGTADKVHLSQTFGSSTKIPVITVNQKGQITAVTNTSVAGVSAFSYSGGEFRNFYIDTADGNRFTANISAGSISTNTLAIPVDHDNNALTTHFDGSNTVQTFGSSTKIPQILVNSKGQVIKVANVDVAGVSGVTFTQANSNLRISTADGSTYDVNIHDGQPSKLEGTSNEITVNAKDGDANTYVVGLPDDVTISGQLTVTENAYISGNLFVGGTSTTINTSEMAVEDNIIKLNKGVTGSNVLDSGIEIERGSLTNKYLIWDESEDKWSIGVGETLVGDLEGNADTATALETARNFSITGDVTASAVSFDGTQNVSLTVDIDADTITSRELNSSVSLKIYDASGTLQKTLYGSGT